MKCPECTTELRPHFVAGVHLDRCEGCSGIWFDHGELETYREKIAPPETRARPQFIPEPREANKRCPGCGQVELVFGRLEGHPLRRCGSCQGLFVSEQTIRALNSSSRIQPGSPGTGGTIPEPIAGDVIIEVGDALITILEDLSD